MAIDDDEDWSAMRMAIDDVLGRAREEWSHSARDGETIVLVATLDDACVRIRASVDKVEARARDLLDAGWTVELRDLSDRTIPWNPADGVVRIDRDGDDEAVDSPLLVEADLPPLPDPEIDRLRGQT
jgi:hypothetical protein